MEVKLIVLHGKSAGKEVPVPGPKFFIGRAEDCHLRPQSDAVSRHHCAVLVEDGFVSVRDFGSKNGTFVNGERLLADHRLTAKAGFGLQAPGLVQHVVFLFFRGLQRIEPFAHIDVTGRAGAGC